MTFTAEVRIGLWMGLFTRNGKTMMRQLPFTGRTLLFSLLLLFAPFSGCAFFQKTDEVEVEIPQEKNMENYEVLVKESRAEAERLRSELATIKIAAAKNNGIFKPTQGATYNPSAQEEKFASEIQKLQAENLKLGEERDQLRHQNVQLQARSEALPGMRQLVMDIKALQTAVHQLVQKMETLSADIVQVKQEMALKEQTLQAIPPKLTKLPTLDPSEDSPERATITVEYGDTLWEIARTHGISVKKLKEMNGLVTDSIFVDQQLEVPFPQSGPSEPDPEAALAAKNRKKKSNDVTANEGAPNVKEGP